eukprot:13522313-Alexandrium_andersonii.AAC.1
MRLRPSRPRRPASRRQPAGPPVSLFNIFAHLTPMVSGGHPHLQWAARLLSLSSRRPVGPQPPARPCPVVQAAPAFPPPPPARLGPLRTPDGVVGRRVACCDRRSPPPRSGTGGRAVSYTHLRAHETSAHL